MQNFSEEEDDEIHHVQLKSVDDELTKNKHHTYAISFQGSGWDDDETAIKQTKKRNGIEKFVFTFIFPLHRRNHAIRTFTYGNQFEYYKCKWLNVCEHKALQNCEHIVDRFIK